MPVFRVEKNKGYTVMSNHHPRNKDLPLKAKGLLSQMLSLPEDWDYGSYPGRAREYPKGNCGQRAGRFRNHRRLWTLGRTREYIQKKYHKAINKRTLSDYMKRWGMSCQRPAKRARKQNSQGI